jgi:uncharacterized protein YgiM (DUF1202 family)
VDASRLNKAALILGIVATILVFVLVLRLLNVTGSPNSSVALETVVSGAAPAATQAEPPSPSASPGAAANAGQVSAVASAYPNVHSSIGVTSPIVGILTRGESVPVVGRSADGVWLEIRYDKSPNGLGWVSADLMAVSPSGAALPVATPP